MDNIQLNKIVEFIRKNYYHSAPEEIIKNFVESHLFYKTCLVLWDKGEVIAVCRWNIEGNTAHILDLIIDTNYHFKRIWKGLLIEGLKVWKNVEYLSWERGKKYPDRKTVIYKVSNLLRR